MGNEMAGLDSAERLECRVAALELFCRCAGTAPRQDMVFQLRETSAGREDPTDTVLQRIVMVCHHELLCLTLHGFDGGPWHSPELRTCAQRRLRAADVALTALSLFTWRTIPRWMPDGQLPTVTSLG